jgi:hypothetical protein
MSLFEVCPKIQTMKHDKTKSLNNYNHDYGSNYKDCIISINIAKKNIAIGTYIYGVFDNSGVRKFLISLAKYVKNSGSKKTENEIANKQTCH